GFRPFLIHRLDRDTAGCIAVASNPGAASRYSGILADRSATEKVYRALVRGIPDASSGVIRDEIRTPSGPRRAETRWRLLASGSGFSLLELELGTGRMHQIRIHLSGRGLPILGDDRHGDFTLNRRLARDHGLRHLALYAARLVLAAESVVRAEAPPPLHLRAFLDSIGDGGLKAALLGPADSRGIPTVRRPNGAGP
ncbi:MAG TPA: RNA pseudouridine synthase, partial [Magnetospirillaceae bacterium]|nr:RNA pseudouridine synthase [Magnetospirillaceae bacterium]